MQINGEALYTRTKPFLPSTPQGHCISYNPEPPHKSTPFRESHGYIIDQVLAEAASQVCSVPETTVETSTIEQRTGRRLTQCGRDSDLAAEPR